MDLTGSAILVGKALNDPVKGLAALNRVGVQFDESQKKQIKRMVKAGNVAGAQRVILRELEKQTRGSAVAQSTNADRMKVAWGNVEEALGRGLLPAVDQVQGGLTRFLRGAQPDVERMGRSLERNFKRDDLTVGEKLQESFRLVRRDGAPLIADLRKRWRRDGEPLARDLLDGLERANLPARIGGLLGHAMAAAAPRAASTFVAAFKAAPVWTTLSVGALLFGRAGATAAGGAIARGLGRAIKRKFAQQAVGSAVADSIARGTATSMGPALDRRQKGITGGRGGGRWSRLGRIAGRSFGLAAAVGAAWSFRKELANASEGGLGKFLSGRWLKGITDPAGKAIGDLLGTNRKATPRAAPRRRGPSVPRRSSPISPKSRASVARSTGLGRASAPPRRTTTIEVPVRVGRREIGRASAEVALDDMARA
jgi:hypothetical protein